MGASLACAIQPGENIFEILDRLSQILRQPFSLHYTVYTGKCILILSFAYITGICIYYSQQKNYRRGVEHGSARWGDVHQICKRYADKEYTHNLLLTQNFRMSQEVYKHQRNLNVLVAGGSGAGKSRTYAVPNILQCSQAESKKGGGCSIVVTDPKGELLRKTGGLLERMGYEVRVFDLINPDTSFCYNPFCYVHDDKDVLKLINNLIRNTTPKGSQASDPFWEKSETALLQALMLYLLHEAPPEEQNFPMIMEMLGSAQVKEEDEEYRELRGNLPFPLLKVWKDSQSVIREFKAQKNCVLFAAGSCWEGVDFPGDVVSSLIIVRLPFAVPDPVREAERERYQTLKEYIQKIIVPDMQIKLRQGFGRAIRTETDTCVVSILDSRAGRGGKYHKEVIDALPVCRITDRMADVENFIRNRKRIEYYM